MEIAPARGRFLFKAVLGWELAKSCDAEFGEGAEFRGVEA
jgi:hypothetical protein